MPDPDAATGYVPVPAGEYVLAIHGAGNALMVAIGRDGTVRYGPAFTTEQEAARTFWRAMSEEMRRWLALGKLIAPTDNEIVSYIARAVHTEEQSRGFIGPWEQLTVEMQRFYIGIGRRRLESVRAAEAALRSESLSPATREFFAAQTAGDHTP